MANDFIPHRDSELDPFLNNFQQRIAAAPASYGVVAGDAAVITASYNAFHSAYLLATNPATRTHSSIAAKDAQRILTVDVIRTYANTIRANVAVSDTLKIDLGLNIHDTVPTPVPPPTTWPVLAIAGAGPLLQDLNAHDVATPNRRAKPVGTSGLLVFRAIGTTPSSDPDSAQFLGFVTRAAFTSNFAAADDGKIATYFGRWTNAKGEMGPWSQPVSMRIAA